MPTGPPLKTRADGHTINDRNLSEVKGTNRRGFDRAAAAPILSGF